MYDELDPSVAVERVAESCEQLPDWLGKRRARLAGVSMGWNSKLAVMGKPTSDNQVFLHFDDLVSLCTLDCGQTLGCLLEPYRLMDTTTRGISCGSRRWTQ